MREAALFLKALAEQDENTEDRLVENAKIFEQVSQLLEDDPHQVLNETKVTDVAHRLLIDGGIFFKSIGEHNEEIKEQMEMNAGVYERLAELVKNDPDGIIEDK